MNEEHDGLFIVDCDGKYSAPSGTASTDDDASSRNTQTNNVDAVPGPKNLGRERKRHALTWAGNIITHRRSSAITSSAESAPSAATSNIANHWTWCVIFILITFC